MSPVDVTTTPTVLVVDDDEHARKGIAMAIEALGAMVETAAGGEQALSALSDRAYDAVVCDLMMPGMCGDELYHRCLSLFPQVAGRFIFLSGAMGSGPSAPAAASGQPCLAKPCRLAELESALTTVLPRPKQVHWPGPSTSPS